VLPNDLAAKLRSLKPEKAAAKADMQSKLSDLHAALDAAVASAKGDAASSKVGAHLSDVKAALHECGLAAKGMPRNFVLWVTDQENDHYWFPPAWTDRNLPFYSAISRSGVTFRQAKTVTDMCSPARASLFTSTFENQHNTKQTLTSANYQSPWEVQLRPELPNLATIFRDVGYDVRLGVRVSPPSPPFHTSSHPDPSKWL
jgi:hypothetical protein